MRMGRSPRAPRAAGGGGGRLCRCQGRRVAAMLARRHGRGEGSELHKLGALGEQGGLEGGARAELAQLLLGLGHRVRHDDLAQGVDALLLPEAQHLAPA